ncbi:hypothetical protein SUGI_0098670 [Cryptomeria japonica]|nr:hypothetical protein SUGI_0098670 [Cryptomeria japonica]
MPLVGSCLKSAAMVCLPEASIRNVFDAFLHPTPDNLFVPSMEALSLFASLVLAPRVPVVAPATDVLEKVSSAFWCGELSWTWVCFPCPSLCGEGTFCP